MTDKSAREIVAAYIQNKVIVDDGSWSNGWPTAYMITDDILAALEAGGFAAVPKEPTQDMRVAGVEALWASFKPQSDRLRALPKNDMPPAWTAISVVSSQNTDPVWSAMLAASNPKEEGSDN